MKNKKLYGLLGVAALAVVGGTFAYYSSEQTFSNPFDTTKYSTSTTEKFNPSGDNQNWEPGSTVDKEVYATNTGKGDVWVRVKFEEAWRRNGELLGVTSSSNAGAKYHFVSKDGLSTFGVKGAEGGITVNDSKSHQGIGNAYSKDGIISSDSGSVVMKNLVDGWDSNWYFNSDDGYFYYRKVLAPGKNTDGLLDSVTLCSDTDMGAFLEPEYYIALDEEASPIPTFPVTDWEKNKDAEKVGDWTKGKPATGSNALKDKYVYTYKGKILDPDKLGYANADYQLDITVELLQTTDETENNGIILDSGWNTEFLKHMVVDSAEPIPAPTD